MAAGLLINLPLELLDYIIFSIYDGKKLIIPPALYSHMNKSSQWPNARTISNLARTCKLLCRYCTKYICYPLLVEFDSYNFRSSNVITWLTSRNSQLQLYNNISDLLIFSLHKSCRVCDTGDTLVLLLRLLSQELVLLIWWTGCWSNGQDFHIGIYGDKFAAHQALNSYVPQNIDFSRLSI